MIGGPASPPPIRARQPDGGLVLVLADRFSVDHLLARVDQGGPGQIIEIGSSSYRLAHAQRPTGKLSGLARNFGDVFELWSGGQCGVGVVVGGDALE